MSKILGDAPTKSTAISLSENSPVQFDGATVVSRLYKSLACDGWEIPVGKNWEWRTEASDYLTSSPEVALEREVVEADTANQWTCQMSTASGIQGPYLNKRRAIDLIRRNGPDRYAFVELKVNSDNPLYAVFEILGYALAYLHARQNSWEGAGRYNVMCAQEIDMVVLGPGGWYEYKRGRTHVRQLEFKFGWLAQALENGLNSLPGETPRMYFSCKKFTDRGDTRLTATEIVRNAIGW